MMNTMSFPGRALLGAFAAVLVLCAGPLAAQPTVDRLIPFQGRVTDSIGDPLQGVYRVTFAIYSQETGGEPLWLETHESVSVLAGGINILLGSLTPLDDPDRDPNTSDAVSFAGAGIEAVGPRYLGIKVGEGTNQEMVPRHELVPSFHARTADRVVKGGIATDQLADGAVTTLKMSPEAGVPVGAVIMWWGAYDAADPDPALNNYGLPPGFEICDGANVFTNAAILSGPKPDLRDRFPLGAGGSIASAQGQAGGDSSATAVSATALTEGQMATHKHVGGQHSHFEYGGLALGVGQCQVGAGVTSDPSANGEEYRRVLGYLGPEPNARYQNCPQDGVDVHFPPPPGGVGRGLGSPIVGDGPRGQTHSHSRPPIPAYLSMHFIIRVK